MTFTYQWQRDGVAIKGPKSDDRTYKVTNADVGHRLTVVVTAHAAGSDPVSATSAEVLVSDSGPGNGGADSAKNLCRTGRLHVHLPPFQLPKPHR